MQIQFNTNLTIYQFSVPFLEAAFRKHGKDWGMVDEYFAEGIVKRGSVLFCTKLLTNYKFVYNNISIFENI
jgi:hypothetical protein